MKKSNFYLELSNTAALCGGFLCSTLEMTEKQVVKFAERIGREFFANNPEMRGRTFYDINVCADEECLELVLSVSVWRGKGCRSCDVAVYDYRTEQFIDEKHKG